MYFINMVINLFIIIHTFHDSLKEELSNGMVIVSTMPGPQYIHSDANIESISSFLTFNSLYYLSRFVQSPYYSFFVFHMLRAFIKENEFPVSFFCLCYSLFLLTFTLIYLIYSFKTAIFQTLKRLNVGWFLTDSNRQSLWNPCMQGNI